MPFFDIHPAPPPFPFWNHRPAYDATGGAAPAGTRSAAGANEDFSRERAQPRRQEMTSSPPTPPSVPRTAPRYPREIVLPLGTDDEYVEAAAAITLEHRAASEWKRLRCVQVECIEPTERLYRLDTGAPLGLEYGWEGSTALRPPGGTAGTEALARWEEDEDRLLWSGPVVEADETSGSLFVVVDGVRPPSTGSFYVRPFEFTALLKQLYTANEHRPTRFYNVAMTQASLTVYLAAPRGFCAGVDRAIEIVEQALALYGAPIYCAS